MPLDKTLTVGYLAEYIRIYMDSPDSMDGLFELNDMDDSGRMNFDDEPNWLEDLIKDPLLADYFLNSTNDILDLDVPLDVDGKPVIQSEHSYSVNKVEKSMISHSVTGRDCDFEPALFNLVNPNLAMTPEDVVNIEEELEYFNYTAVDDNNCYSTIDSSEITEYSSNSSEDMQYVSTVKPESLDYYLYESLESFDSTTTSVVSDPAVYSSNEYEASMQDEVEMYEAGNPEVSISSVEVTPSQATTSQMFFIKDDKTGLSSSSSIKQQSPTNSSAVPSSTIVLTYQPNAAIKVSGKTPTIIVTKSGASTSLALRQNAPVPVGFVRVGSSMKGGMARVSGNSFSMSPSVAAGGEQMVKVIDSAVAVSKGKGEDATLPPSPPNSDSEGASPRRAEHSSPTRPRGLTPLLFQRQQQQRRGGAVVSILNPTLTNHQYEQHTSSGYHVTPSGRLLLTDEERRTLISEGYPVPTRLPLTKQDELNLKKIQRKIKNKMSAQESRRKKKDYLECLEKKLEISNQENLVLKKQVESLQADNKSLQAQVNKLQQLASKLKPSIETSTCVMVFVLFFAMFTSTFLSPTLLLTPGQHMKSMWSSSSSVMQGSGQLSSAVHEDYRTPNMKSRTLMSTTEDDDPTSQSVMFPSCYLLHWLSGKTVEEPNKPEPLSTVQPPNHKSVVESTTDHIVGTAQTPALFKDVEGSKSKEGSNLAKDRESGANDSARFEAADVIVYTTSGAANLSESAAQELRTVAV